ncbi:MED6 mediator sub complex component-domain-containing protein [Tuber indicum]|nr:MED6 mediator sub complex component-domain-containing protein [Tuber indicum]
MATIPRPKTPIDETLWRDQVWYRQWGPITEVTAMDYFRMSTFFDHTSNNGTLFQQMQFNPQFREELRTPELFNRRLATMTGVEYMLAAGSVESGVWVIRKQLRKSPRYDDNGREDDITVLAAYYIIGENIYQAPSIGAVLQNRMLTTISALRSALTVATNLSSFLPTTSTNPSSSSQASQTITTGVATSSQQSVSASQPPPSTQSSMATSTPPPPPPTTSSSYVNDPRLLARALDLSIKHRNEYMDDHAPLLGDPASFLQSQPSSQRSSTPNPQADVAAKKQAAAVAAAAKKAGMQQQQQQQQGVVQGQVKKKGKGLGP